MMQSHRFNPRGGSGTSRARGSSSSSTRATTLRAAAPPHARRRPAASIPSPTASTTSRSGGGRSMILTTAAAAMQENPQNRPEVDVVPAPALSARAAVEAQVAAIVRNDDPWPNHGIATMYEFCYDAGSMERSRYFGFSKDLYHLDHYMGALGNYCRELINCRAYAIGAERPPRDAADLPPGAVAFDVTVEAGGGGGSGSGGSGEGGGAAVFEFVMLRQEWGLRQGAWQTKTLKRVEAGS